MTGIFTGILVCDSAHSLITISLHQTAMFINHWIASHHPPPGRRESCNIWLASATSRGCKHSTTWCQCTHHTKQDCYCRAGQICHDHKHTGRLNCKTERLYYNGVETACTASVCRRINDQTLWDARYSTAMLWTEPPWLHTQAAENI